MKICLLSLIDIVCFITESKVIINQLRNVFHFVSVKKRTFLVQAGKNTELTP